MGMTLLSGRTPRDSLGRVLHAMPYHCSHEIISLVRGPEHTEVRDYWNLQLDPEARHMIEQVVAAILQALLSLARPDAPLMKRIEMTPHPVLGLEHLRPWFGGELVPSRRPYLAMTVPNEVLDTRYRKAPGMKPPTPEPEDRTRLTDLSMSGSIRLMLLARLREGSPSIRQMAAISGMSVRSLQRSLALEGISYSDLVEQVRRDLATAAVVRQGVTMGEVAANLGYSKQSSFTRAFRRWEGVPPMAHRSARTGDEG
jgi:AraC-like DNA-binding protein